MKTAIALLGLMLSLFAAPAHAGKYIAPGHHEYHWWYQEIQKELGIKDCCDDNLQDCGPVAYYADLGDKGVKVVLEDGVEYLAHPTRKYYVNTPDGRAHICRLPNAAPDSWVSSKFLFYCAFLPNPGM